MLHSSKVRKADIFAVLIFILVPLSWNSTDSLYRTILYLHKLQRWQSFSLFALLELVCTKNVFTLYIIPYLFTPSLFPFEALLTDRLPKFFTPCSQSNFFIERVGPYPQAQLYWAGQTVGWMADRIRFGVSVSLGLKVVLSKRLVNTSHRA